MTRRLNLFLLVLLLVIGVPFYWLLIDTSPWNVPAQPVAMAQLRSLAGSIPGAKPQRVGMEIVGYRLLPGDVLAAGSGLKRRTKGILAFILPVPGQGPVVIETGMTAAIAAATNHRFDPAAQLRVDAQMRKASLVLATHEHGDHLGGLARLAGGPDGLLILTKARLNRWQVPQADPDHALGWPAQMSIAPSISELQPQAVGPGVVVVPSPSHTPGSQMIFVQLADGSEYLFTGDIASLAAGWIEQRPRSRLVTDYLTPEDRRATLSWLATIAALKKAAPQLRVIASHDYDWLINPENHSGVSRFNVQAANNHAGIGRAPALEALSVSAGSLVRNGPVKQDVASR
ncbi:MAG: MBL fold metallo-hydrolase [Novosphingobium sp.]